MEVLPDIERKNSAVSALARIAAASRARAAAATPAPATTTLADGRVLDRSGKVIFTPSPVGKLNPK